VSVQQCPGCGRLVNLFVNGRRCPNCRRETFPHDAMSPFDGESARTAGADD
jgi:hypothetical protein